MHIILMVPVPVVPLGTLAAPPGWWMGGRHMERNEGNIHFPRNQVSPVEFLINRYAESHSVIEEGCKDLER